MAANSDDRRIRKGLKFITRADKAVIHAAVPLEKLEGETNPQGVDDLIDVVSFDVAGYTYVGRMTQEQYDYLQGFTSGTLRQFADAIAKVLLKMNGNVLDALKDLGAALQAPAAQPAALLVQVGGIDPPPTGCCTFDTNQQKNGITQAFCEGGLEGHWSPNPCSGSPHSKKEARRVRAHGAR